MLTILELGNFNGVKVEEPEFTYGNPDQSLPERDSFDYKDIFEDGDEVVKALENLTGNKKMVLKTVFLQYPLFQPFHPQLFCITSLESLLR